MGEAKVGGKEIGCHLTPAHHLRGAAQNRELSAKVGHISAQSGTVAAPRLLHALVRPLSHPDTLDACGDRVVTV
jgi:hypothetical protein